MKPEDYIYREWRKHAYVAVSPEFTKNMSIAARAMVDAIQRVLEDYSPYGHELVFKGPHTKVKS